MGISACFYAAKAAGIAEFKALTCEQAVDKLRIARDRVQSQVGALGSHARPSKASAALLDH